MTHAYQDAYLPTEQGLLGTDVGFQISPAPAPAVTLQ